MNKADKIKKLKSLKQKLEDVIFECSTITGGNPDGDDFLPEYSLDYPSIDNIVVQIDDHIRDINGT